MEISPSEKDLLAQLRDRVQDLELTEEELCDNELVRWLRAREHNLENVEKMLRESTAWRRKIDSKNLLLWEPDEYFPNMFPHSICGFDLEGSPVVIFPLGKMDFRTAVDDGYLDEGKRYLYRVLEKILAHLRKVSAEKGCTMQLIVVADVNGLQLRQLTSIKLLNEIAAALRVYEANYPETLKAAVVVNVPSIFEVIYRMVTRILNPKTVAKIKIFDSQKSKYSEELLRIISPSEFPAKYGGTGKLSTNLLDPKHSLRSEDTNGNLPELEYDLEDMTEMKIGAGKKSEVSIYIEEEGTILSWAIQLEYFDIGFSILYGQKETVEDYIKISSDQDNYVGSLVCNKAGRYTLSFDNTYSRIRSKRVHYATSVVNPTPTESVPI